MHVTDNLTPGDARVAAEIVKVLRGASQEVPEALERLASSAVRVGGGGGG